MPWSTAFAAAGASLLFLALPASALDEAAPAATSWPLEWEGPASCPGTRDVHERLSARLGHEPARIGDWVRVRGTIVPNGARLQL